VRELEEAIRWASQVVQREREQHGGLDGSNLQPGRSSCRCVSWESWRHEVSVIDGWANGKVMGIRCDRERGVLSGAVSPRRAIGYALGW
jgi:hypothetical protein